MWAQGPVLRRLLDPLTSVPADGVVLIDPEYLKERKGEASGPPAASRTHGELFSVGVQTQLQCVMK